MKNKIYLFYLVTTEYSIQKLTAMSNYMYDMHMYRDPVNRDIVVVMYAWTANKNLKKTFLHVYHYDFNRSTSKLNADRLLCFKR